MVPQDQGKVLSLSCSLKNIVGTKTTSLGSTVFALCNLGIFPFISWSTRTSGTKAINTEATRTLPVELREDLFHILHLQECGHCITSPNITCMCPGRSREVLPHGLEPHSLMPKAQASLSLVPWDLKKDTSIYYSSTKATTRTRSPSTTNNYSTGPRESLFCIPQLQVHGYQCYTLQHHLCSFHRTWGSWKCFL
jgi:hypothetical protein